MLVPAEILTRVTLANFINIFARSLSFDPAQEQHTPEISRFSRIFCLSTGLSPVSFGGSRQTFTIRPWHKWISNSITPMPYGRHEGIL